MVTTLKITATAFHPQQLLLVNLTDEPPGITKPEPPSTRHVNRENTRDSLRKGHTPSQLAQEGWHDRKAEHRRELTPTYSHLSGGVAVGRRASGSISQDKHSLPQVDAAIGTARSSGPTSKLPTTVVFFHGGRGDRSLSLGPNHLTQLQSLDSNSSSSGITSVPQSRATQSPFSQNISTSALLLTAW